MQRCLAHGLALALLFASLGAAQGPNNSEATSANSTASSAQTKPVARNQAKAKPYQVGTASWYGEYFVGKTTASGEPYDMYDMTAASETIPLGTYVKVTNLHNGKAVVVRVNDRGPVVEGRIIDLSYGAASALQFTNRGIQRVRLDLVSQNTAKRQTVAYQSQRHQYQEVAYNQPPLADLQ
jgi:rare lipoprotein A